MKSGIDADVGRGGERGNRRYGWARAQIDQRRRWLFEIWAWRAAGQIAAGLEEVAGMWASRQRERRGLNADRARADEKLNAGMTAGESNTGSVLF
ncbi:hypothetical protein M0R45_019534 [Rubus argutus]|uniref:Uncharacterized protein n=1 Tax=Rubus argutus TaxID=59490 RepID=A0AAW1X826_RUBAR